MRKRTKLSRILALVLTLSLVFQQAGITTYADDGTNEAAVSVTSDAGEDNGAEVTASQEETKETGTTAAETAETSTPATEAAAETDGSATKETTAETSAPATEAAQSSTSEQETPDTSAAEAETNAANGDAAEETVAEETTEAVTEATTDAAAEGETEATTDTAAEAGTEAAVEAETEMESETDTEIETETESEVETESETEVETETESETETEEYPDTFVWEDDEKTVTVVLSEPEALPLGAEFVVKDPTEEEFEAYKALIIEQQFANDETYGETVEERTALAQVLLANLVLYDMHFEYEGTEIEPDPNTMSVTIKNKKAVDVSTDEVVESDGYVFVQEEDAESSIVAIHIEENGKEETVVDVTEEVKTNSNGDVKKVELTVEGFSTIGYYPLTEYQQLPITDDTLIDDWGGSYTLYFILNNYNIFTSGNAVAQHTVGAVAVGGTSSFTYGIGASNYGVHPVPSYFQGGFVEGGFNSYIGGNAIYFTGYDSNVYSWAYQSYDVRFNDGGTGTIDSSVTHDNGYFIDFTKAMAAIEAEMYGYVNSSSNISVNLNNTAATLEDDHYTVTYNGSSITVTVQSGYSYVFDDLDAIDYINVITSGDSQNVNIISKESGTVVLPKVLVKGSDPTGSETDYGCGLVFMLPNASTVDIGSKSNGTFLGHVVAPNAAVVSDASGNTNGSFICASFDVPSMENHMWHYNGSLITSDSHGLTAMKTLDGAAPTDADDDFSFVLCELTLTYDDNNNDYGWEWKEIQRKKSAYDTGMVTFDSITYDAEGTHWYLIYEVTGDTKKYNFDTTWYLVEVVVELKTETDESGNTTTGYKASATYYKLADNLDIGVLSKVESTTTTNENNEDITTYSVTVDKSDVSKLIEVNPTSEISISESYKVITFGNTTITGSLWITKNVTVNGASTTSTDADGTYTFYVKDSSGTTVKTVEITITNGVSETVEVNDLPVGTYTVEEDVSLNPTGMSLTGGNDISVIVTEDGTAATSTASFTNDMEKVGSLKITKNVT
ncbi:MAG: hypothetical protein LIO99_10040, partial [Clostridiales bacterium]|nr:hypothetical protein [Clostridiales bacterium]